MISDPINERLLPLFGEEGLKELSHSKVVVFGLGGVGGTAFEALVRSGVSPLIGVDFDIVEASNLNRQLLFTYEDIGKKKADIALKRAKAIRPNGDFQTFDLKVDEDILNSPLFLDAAIWIDAVDDIKAKIALIEMSKKHNIPLYVSLGMGNRCDPAEVFATTLDKSYGDPLAKTLRKKLRDKNISLKSINVVLSKELPRIRSSVVSSSMMVPSEAGLVLASLTIRNLLKW